MTGSATSREEGRETSAAAKSDVISSRTERLRRLVLAAPYELCLERARSFTESYRRTEGQHPALRSAHALAHTLRNMTVYILDDEAIVGNRSSKLVAGVIPIERGEINVVLEMELEQLTRRPERPFQISAAEKRELVSAILPYWRGKTIRDRKKQLWREHGLYFPMRLTPASLVDRVRGFGFGGLYKLAAAAKGNLKTLARAGEELAFNNPGLVMNVFDMQGHLVLGHQYLLPEGFAGARKRAEVELAKRGDDPEARAFLEAVIICCDAAKEFAARFAIVAEQKARHEKSVARRQELLAIAARCRRVPFSPPRDFREALQSVWLTQVLALVAHGMTGVFALGRVDQYLYPYLKADLERGAITEAAAVSLLEELLVKLSYNLLVLPSFGKQSGSELGSDDMAITLGGVTRAGEDAVNPLTYLFITALENMRSLANAISFRVSPQNPPAYLERALAIHRRNNGPSFFNDEAVVPALAATGYTLADARDYAIIGCVEPTSDGNTFGCTSGNDISLVGALEMALHNGYLRMTGRRLGPATGDPRGFTSFAQVMDAYKKQVAACVDLVARGTKLKDQAFAEMLPNPLVSILLKGCLENGKDMTHGGAQYNFNSISGRGLATAVNSLVAIRKFVFEEKSLTMAELLAAADRNFKGDEALRQRLINRAPKYGNDDAEADELARELQEFFCGEVMKHTPERGGIFRPGFFSYGMHVVEGQVLGATPDGRRAGEPVSNSLSPTNQSEQHGPIALLASAAKLNHRLIPNGSSTNLKLMPGLIAADAGLQKVAAMVRAYFRQGGMQCQFNVVSNETLRKAQAAPDSYRDLVVRVSGYSAYFTDLGKPVQDDIIARCEFARM